MAVSARRRAASAGAAVLVVALVALIAVSGVGPGPGGPENAAPTPSPRCDGLAAGLVQRLQEYVDSTGGVPAVGPAAQAAPAPTTGEPVDPATEIEEFSSAAESLHCDPGRLREQLTREAEQLEGATPTAVALAGAVRTRLLGNPDASAATVHVEPGEDVAAAVADAGPGATVVLSAGTHRLAQPLVVLQPLTLRGPSRDTTTLVSDAGEAVLVYLSHGLLTVEGLTLAHDGTREASVLFVGAGSLALRDARVTGAVAGADGAGGAGIVLGGGQARAASGPGPTPDERTQEIVRSEVFGNATAGLAVTGVERPVVAESVFTGNGCGVCWFGTSAGALRSSTVSGNNVGVAVLGAAAPAVEQNEITGNPGGGVYLEEDAAGAVTGNILRDNGEVAVAVTAEATTRIDGNTVSGHTGAGLVVTGASRPAVVGNSVDNSRIGIQVDGASAPSLVDNQIGPQVEIAILLAGTASGWVEGTRCRGGAAVVLQERTSAAVTGDGCTVQDRRLA